MMKDRGVNTMVTILVADDDVHILELVSLTLRDAGYDVLTAKDGMEALSIAKKQVIDAAVLDVMMPFMDGFELTKELRENIDLPIILLTAKNQINDKAKGYESGTDDYLVKPFDVQELLFRLKALLRRYHVQEDSDVLKAGNLMIYTASFKVVVGNETFFLPPKEFELLRFLVANKRQAFTREQLIEHVWGLDFVGDTRTVDVHVKRLREHFRDLVEDIEIKTVRGVGYMLEVYA